MLDSSEIPTEGRVIWCLETDLKQMEDEMVNLSVTLNGEEYRVVDLDDAVVAGLKDYYQTLERGFGCDFVHSSKSKAAIITLLEDYMCPDEFENWLEEVVL